MSSHSLARPATALRQNALLVVRGSSSQFHTTAAPLGRWVRDRSKNRGVSAIHRQPKKDIQISVSKFPLPEPVLDASKRTAAKVDPDHGLWGFFRDKKALPTPEEDHKHGLFCSTLSIVLNMVVGRLIGTEGGRSAVDGGGIAAEELGGLAEALVGVC